MDVYRAIVSKRDRRRYSAQPIDDATLDRIVQAARMAGSARDAQPVRLIVIRDAAQREALASCGRATDHVRTCQVAIAVVLVPEAGVVGAPFAIFRGPFDAGRAAQNLMLAAWGEGVASCPASMHDAEAARLVLGLPEGHVVANVITLGFPDAGEERPVRPRMPLDDYIHYETW
jgi:nitroreductase